MDADYDKLNKEQKLKASLYNSMKQIAREVEEEMEVKVSAQVLATLSEVVNRHVEYYALDLENFAKHARRTNISVDDVKLLVRRNETLLQHLSKVAQGKAGPEGQKKKSKATSSKTAQPVYED